MKTTTGWTALAAAALLSAAGTAGAASDNDYALKARHRLGGEGGWDYLSYDAPSNRLFIARGTRVQVVDPDSGRVQAEIADTPGVHGVALASDLGRGYTSNGRDGSVTVFDLKSLKTLGRIATPGGENPDFITYDPVSHRVFVFNGRSHNASVIDAVKGTLVATIELRGKPEAAVADGKGRVFVDIEDRNELVALDAAKASVEATWPLPGCNEPAGLAMDTAGRRLFVGCHNRALLVVNADNGQIVSTLPIGEGVDATAYDAVTQQIFSSQGDGTLHIYRAEGGDRYRLQQIATTQSGARTMALNPASHAVYLVTADFEELPPAEGSTRPRRRAVPGSFTLLVMQPQAN